MALISRAMMTPLPVDFTGQTLHTAKIRLRKITLLPYACKRSTRWNFVHTRAASSRNCNMQFHILLSSIRVFKVLKSACFKNVN